MNSRERVLAAFAHEEPDRVPAWCGSSAEFWAKAKRTLGIADDEALRIRFGDDFRRVLPGTPAPPLPSRRARRRARASASSATAWATASRSATRWRRPR